MMDLTKSAVDQVKRLMEREESEGLRLRIGVQGGGCNGFSYVMSFETET